MTPRSPVTRYLPGGQGKGRLLHDQAVLRSVSQAERHQSLSSNFQLSVIEAEGLIRSAGVETVQGAGTNAHQVRSTFAGEGAVVNDCRSDWAATIVSVSTVCLAAFSKSPGQEVSS